MLPVSRLIYFYNIKYILETMKKQFKTDVSYPTKTSVSYPTKVSFKIIKNIRPKKVLDIGCGDGEIGTEIKKITNGKVFGIDVSDKATKIANKKGIKSYVCDISSERTKFKKNFFDLIYYGQTIEHVADPDFSLEEIKRILKPNHPLIVTTPNLASWLNRILLLFGIQPNYSEVSSRIILGRKFKFLGQGNEPAGHLRLFTTGSLIDILKYYNFEISEIHGAECPTIQGRGNRLFFLARIIDKIFAKIPPLSSNIVILAINRK